MYIARSCLKTELGMAAHAFNPSTQEAEVGGTLEEFEASLVYVASSRTVRGT